MPTYAVTKRFIAKNGLDANGITVVNVAAPVATTDGANLATVTSAVSVETTRAQAAEAAVSAVAAAAATTTALTTETTTRAAADATLTSNLSAEVTRATTAEGTLTTNLATEASTRTSAINTVTSAVSAETTRATAAEALLVTQTTTVNGHALNSNVIVTASDIGLGNVNNTTDATKPVSAAQASAIAVVQAAVTAEATARAAADTDILLEVGIVNTAATSANTNAAIASAAVTAEITARTAADATTLASAKSYADGLVVGLWDDRGAYNAASNTFPSNGGSGAAGTVVKGDIWTISVAATSGPLLGYPVGSTIRALIDTPAQVVVDWAVGEAGFGYVPETVSNKSTITTLGTSDTLYPSQNAVKTYVDAEATARATAITSEATARTAADAATLVSAKTYTDSTITGFVTASVVTAETTARIAADALLVAQTTTVNGHALTSNVTITAADLSLGNVSNTSDANKPVSTAQATAIAAVQTAVTTENTRASTAENTLTTAVSTAQTQANLGVTNAATANAAIATEVSNRTAADAATLASAKSYTDTAVTGLATSASVTSEASTRATADTLLTTNLSNEVTARTTADATTLSSAKSYADGLVVGVATAASVSTETSRATAAEGLLVAKTVTVNGHALSANVTVTAADVSAIATSQLGANSGVATLDASGKLSSAQIPSALVGAIQYQGVWNASTNTPALVSSTGTKGQYYKVSTAGTTSIDSNANWTVGDLIIFDGAVWEQVQGGVSDVTSVAGRVGAVVLSSTDVGLGNVTNTSDVNKPVSTAQAAADATTLASAHSYTDTAVTGLATSASVTSEASTRSTADATLTTNLATEVARATANETSIAAALSVVQSSISNVSNTSDANKPVSTAQATAIAAAQAAAIAASAPIAHVGSGGTAHANVTTSVAGFMSAGDKSKLDAVTGTNTGDETGAGIVTKIGTSYVANATYATSAGSAGTVTNGVYTNTVNALTIAAPITGFTSGAGTLAATDSILSAINKLNGNIAAATTTANSASTAAGTASTNASTAITNAATAQTTATAAYNALGTTINAQVGTTYTPVLSDASFAQNPGATMTFNNATAQTVTIPPNSSVAYPVGATMQVIQLGAGKVTFAAGAGVTLNSAGSLKSIGAQYSAVTLLQTSANVWVLVGSLIA
jgi:hypothetical protein